MKPVIAVIASIVMGIIIWDISMTKKANDYYEACIQTFTESDREGCKNVSDEYIQGTIILKYFYR